MLALFASLLLAGSPNVEAAERFFEQGRAKAEAGQFLEAAQLFEQSYEADPALGTLLNWAENAAKAGQVAAPYRLYTKALEVAERNRKVAMAPTRRQLNEERIAVIKRAMAQLAPKVRWVEVEAWSPELLVEVQGQSVDVVKQPRVPVEAGPVAVSAALPKFRPWKTTVAAPEPGGTLRVVLPKLEREVDAAAPDRPVVERPAQRLVEPNAEPSLAELGLKAAAPAPVPARTWAGGALLVTGLLALVGGGMALGLSLDTYGRALRQRPGGPDELQPTVTLQELLALRWSYPVSLVALGVGAALGGFGAVLLALPTPAASAPSDARP